MVRALARCLVVRRRLRVDPGDGLPRGAGDEPCVARGADRDAAAVVVEAAADGVPLRDRGARRHPVVRLVVRAGAAHRPGERRRRRERRQRRHRRRGRLGEPPAELCKLQAAARRRGSLARRRAAAAAAAGRMAAAAAAAAAGTPAGLRRRRRQRSVDKILAGTRRTERSRGRSSARHRRRRTRARGTSRRLGRAACAAAERLAALPPVDVSIAAHAVLRALESPRRRCRRGATGSGRPHRPARPAPRVAARRRARRRALVAAGVAAALPTGVAVAAGVGRARRPVAAGGAARGVELGGGPLAAPARLEREGEGRGEQGQHGAGWRNTKIARRLGGV